MGCRRDIRIHSAHFFANAYSNANPDADAHSAGRRTDTDAHSYSYTHADADRDSRSYADADCSVLPDSHSYPDAASNAGSGLKRRVF